jgi:hypothetical protein
MADINIGAKITTDASQSVKSINDLNKEIKSASQALKEAKIGSDEYTKAQNDLKKAQEELNVSTKEKSGTFAQLKEHLKGTVPAFKGAEEGASGLGKQLMALLANPIVLLVAAIVVGLKFLYEAFTSTVEGGKKMAQMMDGLKAILQVLTDRAFAFGNAVIKLFSGDFKGAMVDAKASVSGLADAIETTYTRTAQITKRLQELKKEQREDDVDRAKRERDLALIREKLNDESIPIKERMAAAKQLREEQVKNSADDLKRTTEVVNLKIEKLKMQKEGEKKNADEIAELQKELYNTEKENALEGVRTNKVIRNLEKQERTAGAEERKKEQEEEKARIENIREYENKIKKLKQEQDLAIITDTYKKEKLVAQNALADSIRDIELSFEQKKLTRQQANRLIQEEEKLHNLKLKEIEDKHAQEVYKKEQEIAKEKEGILSRGKTRMIALEKEEIDGRIKQRAGFIKLLDSELKLAQARKIATIEMEQEAFNTKRALERQSLIDSKANAEELQAFDNETAAAKIALDDSVRDAKNKNLAIVAQAASTFSNLIGQQTLAGKALGVASATIDTYIAAGKALKSAPPPFGAIAMAATIAQGLMNVKRIVSVQVPGASGGVSSPSTPSIPSAPLTPQSGATTLNSGSIQQIGNAAAPRAFVVESDIRNNQERITMLNRAARIGG